ncbi:MAG: hypothetical protein NUV61_03925 [Candidatus Azambacteria bacterium]|nr:hypothetical protein [Candidatus Azambacteria bacterium]
MESIKEVIASGKTKDILAELDNATEALVRSKKAITAGDGDSRIDMEGKDVLATTIAVNCFRLLNAKHIPTHFLEQVDANTFRAVRLRMMPIEVVIRDCSYGSRNKRYPHETKGKPYARPIVEFFYKDDTNHDPLMIWDHERERFSLYNAGIPAEHENAKMGAVSWKENPLLPKHIGDLDKIEELAIESFIIFRDAFAALGVRLVDMKKEFGYDKDGVIRIGDVIDSESSRLWIGGDENCAIDKDYFRKIAKLKRPFTPAELAKILSDYAVVAHLTSLFLE